jgi:hypothetical protein
VTEAPDTSTPDQAVATQIVKRFLLQGLLQPVEANRVRERLAAGTMKAEDWRLCAEKALEWQSKRGDHAR